MAWWCPRVESWITTAVPCLLPPPLLLLQLEPMRERLPRKNIGGCPSPALVYTPLRTLLLFIVCILVMRASCKNSLNIFSAGFPTDQRNGDKEFVIRRAATNRVLNVLRHWVSKHSPVKHPSAVQGTYIGTVHNFSMAPLVLFTYSIYAYTG